MGPSRRECQENTRPCGGSEHSPFLAPRGNWRHLPAPKTRTSPRRLFPGWAPSSPGISHLQRVESKLPGASGHITPKTTQMPPASLLSFKGHSAWTGKRRPAEQLREKGCGEVTPGSPGCSVFSPCFQISRCHGDRFHRDRQARAAAFPWKHRRPPLCVSVAGQGRTLKDRFRPPPLWPRADAALGWPREASSISP